MPSTISADSRHVEWICRLWAACQGKVRVPILYPDLSAMLLHMFCQWSTVWRNSELGVLVAVIAVERYSFLQRCLGLIHSLNAFELSCF